MRLVELTEEEIELVLKHRETERGKCPIKSGKLKHDLFSGFKEVKLPCWHLTREELDQAFKEYKPTILEKTDALFLCYFQDGAEWWYDTTSGKFAGMTASWAEEHLIDIKPINKGKR